MKNEIYKIKVATQEELHACILDAAACAQEREDQLRRTTRYVRTRTAKCAEVDFGIFEQFL